MDDEEGESYDLCFVASHFHISHLLINGFSPLTFPCCSFSFILLYRFLKSPTFAAKGELSRSLRADMVEPQGSKPKPPPLPPPLPPPIALAVIASCPSWTNPSLPNAPFNTSRRWSIHLMNERLENWILPSVEYQNLASGIIRCLPCGC